MSNQITCITKPNAQDALEHITNVGGTDSLGKPFYKSRSIVISEIKRGERYHVKVGTNDIDVEVESRNRVEYIKTKPDATKRDNLLSLPQCSASQRGA